MQSTHVCNPKTLCMNTDTIRIILVDDHKMVRESLSLLLSFNKRFSIIKTCADGYDAIHQARQLLPDIMLVDVNMDPINGFDVVKNVMETNPTIKIIGISVNNQLAYAERMMELGAKGFLTKDSTLDEMTHAIIEVHSGRSYVSRNMKRTIS
jgi:two-component system invasion response regulator UvrY